MPEMPKKSSPIEDTTPKPFIFIMMQFADDLKNVHYAIKQAAEKAGAVAERLDDRKYTEDMLTRIYSRIQSSAILVADVSYPNPNVYYEIGYAHALNKIVVFTKRKGTEKLTLPFDTSHYPHVLYDEGNLAEFIEELTEYMAVGLSQADERASSMRPVPLNVYIGSVSDETLFNPEKRITHVIGQMGRMTYADATHHGSVTVEVVIQNPGIAPTGKFSDFFLELPEQSRSSIGIMAGGLHVASGNNAAFLYTHNKAATDGFVEHYAAGSEMFYLKPKQMQSIYINLSVHHFKNDYFTPMRIGFYLDDVPYTYEFDLKVICPRIFPDDPTAKQQSDYEAQQL